MQCPKCGAEVDALEYAREQGYVKLPPLTQQPIIHIDGTPDEGYPLRILRAYRENCDCRWADNTEGKEPTNPVLKIMNEHCEQRARLLDKAITILEEYSC